MVLEFVEGIVDEFWMERVASQSRDLYLAHGVTSVANQSPMPSGY
jgi:hypothetical protein